MNYKRALLLCYLIFLSRFGHSRSRRRLGQMRRSRGGRLNDVVVGKAEVNAPQS